MKKYILHLVTLLAAAAQAEFMMWSVSDDQFEGVGLTDVASMRVGYVTADGLAPESEGTALTAYNMKGVSTGGSSVGYVDGAEFQVDLTGLSVDTYSFYIELLNSSGEVIGRTGDNESHTYETYAQLKNGNYVATGDIGTVPSVSVWHGGSFQAVPEPTSLALLAIGAGLAGLRRKLKKGKKEKRA